LCKMSLKEGNEKYQGHNDEEWEAGDSGCIPNLWHQDVQNWESLKHKLMLFNKGQVNYPAFVINTISYHIACLR